VQRVCSHLIGNGDSNLKPRCLSWSDVSVEVPVHLFWLLRYFGRRGRSRPLSSQPRYVMLQRSVPHILGCCCTAARPTAAPAGPRRAQKPLTEADSGAVTLIQRFGSAANLNIHLHCLVLDGVYQCDADGAPVFVEASAPTDDALKAVLHKIITRMMKLPTRRGVLVEEECPGQVISHTPIG